MSTNYQEAVDNYTGSFSADGFQSGQSQGVVVDVPQESSSQQQKEPEPEIIVTDDDFPTHVQSQAHPHEQTNQDEDEGQHADNNTGSHAPNQGKKRKNSVQQRIDQLAYEKGSAEQHANFLAQQLAEKEALIAAMREREKLYADSLAHQYSASNEAKVKSFDADERNLKKELKEAIEAGDIDLQTEKTAELAQLKAEKRAHQQALDQAYQERLTAQYNEEYVPIENSIPQYSPPPDYDTIAWQQENPWYGVDAGLTQEANQIADELQRYCMINNISVSQAQFRNKVSEELRLRYGGSGNSSGNMAPHHAPNNYIAPVSRGNNYMNQNNQSGMLNRNQIRMTKEQYQFAKTLPDAKPGESHAEKAARYAKMIEPIPTNEHGQPIYKLTIG